MNDYGDECSICGADYGSASDFDCPACNPLMEDAVNDEKKHTDADLQRAKRDAYAVGWSHAEGHYGISNFTRVTPQHIRDTARKCYPITKRVPREITMGAVKATVDDDERDGLIVKIVPRNGGTGVWFPLDGASRLADLLANPYEEITE